MKRFSAREFALLCVPVAAIAGVGFWASRRADSEKTKMVLTFEKPSGLQASHGVKTVLKLRIDNIKRKNDEYAIGAVWLQLKRPHGIALWRSDQSSTFKVADIKVNSNYDGTSFVLMKEIPLKPFIVGYDGRVEDTSKPARISYRFEDKWIVNPAQLKAFDLKARKEPALKLQSVTILVVSPKSVSGRAEFVLQGAKMGGQTDFQMELAETRSCLTSWKFDRSNNINSSVRFVNFTVKAPVVPIGSKQKFIGLTGRASADNRWPLAFRIDPFDFNTALVGQKLKFKSWPAPLPPGAK